MEERTPPACDQDQSSIHRRGSSALQRAAAGSGSPFCPRSPTGTVARASATRHRHDRCRCEVLAHAHIVVGRACDDATEPGAPSRPRCGAEDTLPVTARALPSRCPIASSRESLGPNPPSPGAIGGGEGCSSARTPLDRPPGRSRAARSPLAAGAASPALIRARARAITHLCRSPPPPPPPPPHRGPLRVELCWQFPWAAGSRGFQDLQRESVGEERGEGATQRGSETIAASACASERASD